MKLYLQESIVIVLFIILVCLFFPDLAFHQKIPNGGDVNGQFYPQFQLLSTCLKQGIFPLWNPYNFSGIPVFADPQSGFSYPIHLILFGLLNPQVAFGIDLLFHFLLAGWFTYLYLCQIGIKRDAAFLAGICYMFSGFLIPKVLLPPLLFSGVYLPLLLLGIERLSIKPGYINILITASAVTLLLLSGYPQYTVAILSVGLIYACIRLWQLNLVVEKKIEWSKIARITAALLMIIFALNTIILIFLASMVELKKTFQIPQGLPFWILMIALLIAIIMWVLSVARLRWNLRTTLMIIGSFIITLIISLLLAAVYILPGYEFYLQSTRLGMPVSEYVRAIIFFQNLPSIIHDLFVGNGVGDFELSGFIGTTPLILILFAVFMGILHGRFRKYTLIFCLFLLLSSALVFLEPHVVGFIMQNVPVLQQFFVFHRYLLLFVFSLSVLAGIAYHNLVEYIEQQSLAHDKPTYAFLIPWLSLSGMLLLLFGFSNQGALAMRLLPGFGIILLFFLTSGQGIIRFLFPLAAIVITLVELHPQTVGYPLDYIYPSQLYPQQTTYTALKEKDPEFYRVFSIEDEQAPLPTNTAALANFLIPNVASIYHAFDIQGYNPVMLNRYRDYISYINEGKPQRNPYQDATHFVIVNQTASPLLDLLNVKYVISSNLLPLNKSELAYISKVLIKNKSYAAYIYRNRNFIPHAFLVYQARVIEDFRTTLRYLNDPKFNPNTTVILNERFGSMVEKKENLIGKTKVRSPRATTVTSSIQQASIQVDGKEIGDNLPGYNIAVINPDTGDLDDVTTLPAISLVTASVDTSVSPVRNFSSSTAAGIPGSIAISNGISNTSTSQFAQYINGIADGKIVVVAWKGNDRPQITDDMVTALRSIGTIPEVGKGNTYTLIGVKGAPPGTAMESIRMPMAEISIPYTLDVLYRFDKEKLILNELDTVQTNLSPTVETSRSAKSVLNPQIKLIHYSPNRIVYQTISLKPGFLVLSEIHYPGWLAFVDGKPVRILKVNGIFRSIFLNPGAHQVEFRYSPMSLWYGLGISVITLLGLIIIGVIRITRKKKTEQNNSEGIF